MVRQGEIYTYIHIKQPNSLKRRALQPWQFMSWILAMEIINFKTENQYERICVLRGIFGLKKGEIIIIIIIIIKLACK
jgi:hypothetical protein